MKYVELNKDNYLPTAPTQGGKWKDKKRDHDIFQYTVPLAAQLGGIHASAGCPHLSAEHARHSAEQRYYQSQIIVHKEIIKAKK